MWRGELAQYWLEMVLEAHVTGLLLSLLSLSRLCKDRASKRKSQSHALSASPSLFLAAIVLSLKLLCHSAKLYSLC